MRIIDFNIQFDFLLLWFLEKSLKFIKDANYGIKQKLEIKNQVNWSTLFTSVFWVIDRRRTNIHRVWLLTKVWDIVLNLHAVLQSADSSRPSRRRHLGYSSSNHQTRPWDFMWVVHSHVVRPLQHHIDTTKHKSERERELNEATTTDSAAETRCRFPSPPAKSPRHCPTSRTWRACAMNLTLLRPNQMIQSFCFVLALLLRSIVYYVSCVCLHYYLCTLIIF